MLKRSLIVLSTMMMISCTGLGGEALKQVAGAAIGERRAAIEARVNAGKGEARGDQSVAQNANTALSGQVNTTSDYGDVGKVVNESGLKLHELLLLVLLAGWAIPSPSEMLLSMVRVVRNARYVWKHQPPP
jgi:hypothetical protein